MGDQLVALVLFEAANESPTSGSIRILIVLKSVGAQALDKLSDAYQQIEGRKRIAPMVMTLEEMHSSTDVFPITFLEMRRDYRVLTGKDVLADLPIQFGHLRLRCEQELKNLLLRMQTSYLIQHERRQLKTVLQSNYHAFLRTMRAALMLNRVDSSGSGIADSDLQTTEAFSQKFGLDSKLSTRVHQTCTGELNLTGEPLRAVYAALMELVSQAAKAIDQLPEQVEVLEVFDDAGGE